MLKRLVAMLMVISIMVSVSACGSSKPDNLTKETYELGKDALAIMDKYLDGKMDADTAEKKLEKIYEQLEIEAEALQKKAENGDIDAYSYSFNNGNVCFNISSFVMGMFGWENSYGNTYSCQEIRDNLAEALKVN